MGLWESPVLALNPLYPTLAIVGGRVSNGKAFSVRP